MKYLVTGGAGFIGSHLVDCLLSKGMKVVVIDDLSSGKLENLPKGNDNLQIIESCVQNAKLDEIKNINGVYHLAAQASVPVSIDNLYSSSKNNILSSLKAIDWARKLEVPFVYASSSAIYGELELGSDEDELFDLGSPYAVDKLALEHYANVAFKLYNLRSIGLRIFNAYGPRQDPSNPYSGVISIFTDRLLHDKIVTVNGGHQTRDFVYVNDVVRIFAESMRLLHNQSCCECFNVGTGVSVTINDLLKTISVILGVDPEIEYKQLPPGDPERSMGVYNKLIKRLNISLNDFYDLKSGLIETLNYYGVATT